MKESVLDYLLEYLELKQWKIESRGKIKKLCCPLCQDSLPTAIIIPNTSKIRCSKCARTMTVRDAVRGIEPNFLEAKDESIDKYIKDILKLTIVTKQELDDIITKWLNFYIANGFDLVPIARNQKIPIEKDWLNKEHKDIVEWRSWLETGINIGVKTGEKSNITVIDVDQKDIPEELKKLLIPTLVQETNKGWHFIYKYEPSLPTTRIEELKVDILNNGKQFVVFPSIVEEEKRQYTTDLPITTMSPELLQYLQNTVVLPGLKPFSERLKEEIQADNFGDLNIKLVDEGNRTNFLLHLGGVLRKELNINQTSFSLNIINGHLCKPPLPQRELENIVKSLDKYVNYDDQELALKILNYLKIVEEANSRDIQLTLGEQKERIEKALAYLSKEGYLIKKGRKYYVIKKAEWKDTFPNIANEFPGKIPYFYDVATFCWGDLLLLGGKNKKGKTTISINMVKSFVDQGYKPHYICLETGSRFVKTAVHLGMKEGDFWWDFIADPTKIEFEKNAITILDWLLIPDKAMTDLVMKYFVEQLYKTNGILIVFMQLKQDDTWFAPNMVEQFPSLSARYIYDKEEDGTMGKWVIDVIREPKGHYKKRVIPCRYDWESRKLLRIDEEALGMKEEE